MQNIKIAMCSFCLLFLSNANAEDSLNELSGVKTIPKVESNAEPVTEPITEPIAEPIADKALNSESMSEVLNSNNTPQLDTLVQTSPELIVESKIENVINQSDKLERVILEDSNSVAEENKEPELTYLDPTRIMGRKKSFVNSQIGAASHLTNEEILQTQPVGTQELLEKVPGVQSASDDGFGNSRLSIGIRGLNPRRSSRVLIMEDGIPIQPGAYIYPNMYYNPPVERLEEIEILKGSGSILYGPQTMGGVVNYITRKPRRDSGGMLSLVGGTQNLLSQYLEYGGFGNDWVQPELQLLLKQGSGFRENNDFDQINSTLKVNISPNPDEDWYFKLNYNKENTHATYTGLTQYSYDKDPTFNPKDQDVFEVERFAIDLIRNVYSENKWIETTKGYFNFFDRRWWREYDMYMKIPDWEALQDGTLDKSEISNAPISYSGDLVRVGDGSNSFAILRKFYVAGVERSWIYDQGKGSEIEFGSRLHWERFKNERQEGSSGVDGVFDIKDVSLTKIDDEGNLVAAAPSVQAQNFETKSVSAYVQERYQVEKLLLQAGARLEWFEQERIDLLDGSKLSDKNTLVHSQVNPFGGDLNFEVPFLIGLGASYDLSPQHNIFLGTHSGFTPPSSSGLNPNLYEVNSEDGGLDVEAEESWNTEIGMRGILGILQYEAVLFQLDIENQSSPERSTLLAVPARTQSRGIESFVSTHMDKFDDWKKHIPEFHMSYTLMKSEVRDGTLEKRDASGALIESVNLKGNELSYVPRHDVHFGFRKSIGLKENQVLTFRADWHYKSSAYSDIQNVEKTDNLGVTGKIPATPHQEIPMGDFSIILPELLDLSTQFQYNSQFEIFASIKNVYGKKFIGSRLHSTPLKKSASQSSGIIAAPGRQAQAGVRYKF